MRDSLLVSTVRIVDIRGHVLPASQPPRCFNRHANFGIPGAVYTRSWKD